MKTDQKRHKLPEVCLQYFPSQPIRGMFCGETICDNIVNMDKVVCHLSVEKFDVCLSSTF